MVRKAAAQIARQKGRLILDSGALIGFSRGDSRVRSHLLAAMDHGAEIRVPVAVLAETLRGGNSGTHIHRLVKTMGTVRDTTSEIGQLAGSLLGANHRHNTVDAMVVAETVIAGGGTILTGDADDLGLLASGQPFVVVRALDGHGN